MNKQVVAPVLAGLSALAVVGAITAGQMLGNGPDDSSDETAQVELVEPAAATSAPTSTAAPSAAPTEAPVVVAEPTAKPAVPSKATTKPPTSTKRTTVAEQPAADPEPQPTRTTPEGVPDWGMVPGTVAPPAGATPPADGVYVPGQTPSPQPGQ